MDVYNFVHMSKFLFINVNMSREGGLIIVQIFFVYTSILNPFFWLNVRLPFVEFLNNNKKKEPFQESLWLEGLRTLIATFMSI